jgi:phosphate transport system substrate-binding protein
VRIVFAIVLLLAASAQARDNIRIVGSSTLYPFITIAAEKFGKTSSHTPVVESTGTGGGFKLFCSGNSLRYPDMVNASRKIKPSEQKLCKKNLVLKIKEVTIGYDGIVLVQSSTSEKLNLSRKQLFLGVARKILINKEMVDNPYQTWKEIDPSLPDRRIEIYGPSFTSGTRDAFIELVMHEFCNKSLCKEIREDGRYIEMPENDNLIISKVQYNSNALGMISFGLLNENSKIEAIKIDNITPSKESILNGQYPLSRPLFVYFNQDHLKELPLLKDFISELMSDRSLGVKGYLTQKGLISRDGAGR